MLFSVIRHSICRQSPSRDRWQQPIAAAFEDVAKQQKQMGIRTNHESHHISHPQGMGGTSFCAIFCVLKP